MKNSVVLVQSVGGSTNKNLPAMVTNFYAMASSAPSITLTWTNPIPYFFGVMIRKKIGSMPTGTKDGVQVYKGIGTSVVDTHVVFDTNYYYRAFPYNSRGQHQTKLNGSTANAIPKDTIEISNIPIGATVFVSDNHNKFKFYVVDKNHFGYPAESMQLIPYTEHLPEFTETGTASTTTMVNWNERCNNTFTTLFPTNFVSKLLVQNNFFQGAFVSSGDGRASYGSMSYKFMLLAPKEAGITNLVSYLNDPENKYREISWLLNHKSIGKQYALRTYAASRENDGGSWWNKSSIDQTGEFVEVPIYIDRYSTPNLGRTYTLTLRPIMSISNTQLVYGNADSDGYYQLLL